MQSALKPGRPMFACRCRHACAACAVCNGELPRGRVAARSQVLQHAQQQAATALMLPGPSLQAAGHPTCHPDVIRHLSPLRVPGSSSHGCEWLQHRSELACQLSHCAWLLGIAHAGRPLGTVGGSAACSHGAASGTSHRCLCAHPAELPNCICAAPRASLRCGAMWCGTSGHDSLHA
jgi:hypothetical protein